MLLLASTSDKIRLTTSSTANIDVHASFADYDTAVTTASDRATFGRQNTTISTATTTDIVNSPGNATTDRSVKTITIRNRHALTSNTVTVIHTDGTNAMELISVVLVAGYQLCYDEGAGWSVRDNNGKMIQNSSTTSAAVSGLNLVVLASDQVNNNGTANTIQDITGLSFDVVSGEGYWFKFKIIYTSAATTTGSRFTINGPGSPTWLGYRSSVGLASAGTAGTDSFTETNSATYDNPSASNLTSPTASAAQLNTAIIEGFIQPSSNGTVIGRFASEVLSSAITAKKGSTIEWYRAY